MIYQSQCFKLKINQSFCLVLILHDNIQSSRILLALNQSKKTLILNRFQLNECCLFDWLFVRMCFRNDRQFKIIKFKICMLQWLLYYNSIQRRNSDCKNVKYSNAYFKTMMKPIEIYIYNKISKKQNEMKINISDDQQKIQVSIYVSINILLLEVDGQFRKLWLTVIQILKCLINQRFVMIVIFEIQQSLSLLYFQLLN
ncbi:unnamed protein product [Paramecium primaurelia]|uniref:Uncharacterized protein n=1 Tax=Paramecium primaurelia TaxID=5886 RepID=A0A8S1NUG3_PARPR|nr:unnamed protein product [Paramecium primaurelia]